MVLCGNFIFADTVHLSNALPLVCFLGKPKSKEEAIAILSRLSGNTHQVVTGVSILCRVPLPSQSNAAESTADADPTKVKALTEILGLISDAAVYKATCPRSAINDEAKEKGLSNPYTENPKDDPSPNAEQTESASVSSTSEAKSSSSSTSTSTSSSSLKLCFHETTSVDFDVLAQDVIQAYVDGGEPMYVPYLVFRLIILYPILPLCSSHLGYDSSSISS